MYIPGWLRIHEYVEDPRKLIVFQLKSDICILGSACSTNGSIICHVDLFLGWSVLPADLVPINDHDRCCKSRGQCWIRRLLKATLRIANVRRGMNITVYLLR